MIPPKVDYFNTMPLDAIRNILDMMAPKDIKALSSTCRRMQRIASSVLPAYQHAMIRLQCDVLSELVFVGFNHKEIDEVIKKVRSLLNTANKTEWETHFPTTILVKKSGFREWLEYFGMVETEKKPFQDNHSLYEKLNRSIKYLCATSGATTYGQIYSAFSILSSKYVFMSLDYLNTSDKYHQFSAKKLTALDTKLVKLFSGDVEPIRVDLREIAKRDYIGNLTLYRGYFEIKELEPDLLNFASTAKNVDYLTLCGNHKTYPPFIDEMAIFLLKFRKVQHINFSNFTFSDDDIIHIENIIISSANNKLLNIRFTDCKLSARAKRYIDASVTAHAPFPVQIKNESDSPKRITYYPHSTN